MRKTKGKTVQNGALLLCAPLERGINSRDVEKRRAARLDVQHVHRPAHRGLLRMRHLNGLNESPSTEQTSPTCPYNHIKENESNRQCPRYHSDVHNVSVNIKAHLTAGPCMYTSHSNEHGEGVGGGSRGAAIKESEERSGDAVFNEQGATAGGGQCLRTFRCATVLMHLVIKKHTQRHVLIMPMIPVPAHIPHATVQVVIRIGSTYQERGWRAVSHHCVHKGQCGTRRGRRDNDVHDGDSRREEGDRRWLHRSQQGGGVPIGHTAPLTDLLFYESKRATQVCSSATHN